MAVERAWFEQQPLRIIDRDSHGIPSTREVKVEQTVMDRKKTRINACDIAKGESHGFRLDRIEKAEVIENTGRAPG